MVELHEDRQDLLLGGGMRTGFTQPNQHMELSSPEGQGLQDLRKYDAPGHHIAAVSLAGWPTQNRC